MVLNLEAGMDAFTVLGQVHPARCLLSKMFKQEDLAGCNCFPGHVEP